MVIVIVLSLLLLFLIITIIVAMGSAVFMLCEQLTIRTACRNFQDPSHAIFLSGPHEDADFAAGCKMQLIGITLKYCLDDIESCLDLG